MLNAALRTKAPYDAVKEFAPIMPAVRTPSISIAPAALPATSLPDLIALAKSDPGKLGFGLSGQGIGGQRATENVECAQRHQDAARAVQKGAGQASIDLIGAQIQAERVTGARAATRVRALRHPRYNWG